MDRLEWRNREELNIHQKDPEGDLPIKKITKSHEATPRNMLRFVLYKTLYWPPDIL